MRAERQRGVALIGAVLVVSLVAVIATAMLREQHFAVRRTGNLIHGEQAYAYALGAETWARVILRRDAEEGSVDHLDEDWAVILPPIAVEGGIIEGRILDQQGRFNLNNLVDAQGKAQDGPINQYRRLLELLDLDPDLADALVDWMDADEQTRFPHGAEDDRYLSRLPPYRAANRPLADVTELRLIEGYSEAVLEQLLPQVAALPGGTAVNVNTASAEVLASLSEQTQLTDGEQLVEQRQDEPFQSQAAFRSHNALAGQTLFDVPLSVSSDYFLIQGHVQIGRGEIWLRSLLERKGAEIRTLRRSRTLPALESAAEPVSS